MSANPIYLDDVRRHQQLADSLATGKDGIPLNTVSNILAILRHDPELSSLVTLNEFTYDTSILRPPPLPDDGARPMPGPYPRQWTEADEALILAYIQRNWTSRATDSSLRAAMSAEAAMRGYHPVRDWLATLQWDGIHRLDSWMTMAFGADDTQYIRDVGTKFLIAACRRVRHPGCKFDFMLILEGPQGIGKSSALKTLYGDQWFSDSIMHDLAHKDAAVSLIGVWCLEMAEIAQFIRNDTETIKAFLARSTDKYRPSYGRTDVIRPRHGVLVGTTNKSDYLRDETGNRRFWPVVCRDIDLPWIATNRDQLWAEAAARETTDEPIWLEDTQTQFEAVEIQQSRLAVDTWHERIEGYVSHRASVSTPELLETCVGLHPKDHNRSAEMRAASVLTTLGWARVVRWEGGKSVRRWERVK